MSEDAVVTDQPPQGPGAAGVPPPPAGAPPPPPPPSVPPAAPPPPGAADLGLGTAEDDGNGRSRRRMVIGGIAAIALLVVGGGIAAAWNLLAGSDDELAAHVPDDAAAYVHVNLDPSADNKLGIRSLMQRLDDASDEDISVDALVARFQEELADTGIDGIDAQAAWDALGSQAAMWLGSDVFDAAMAGSDPSMIGLLVTLDDPATIADMLDAEANGQWSDANGDAGWLLDDDGVAAIRDDILHIGTADAVNESIAVDSSLAEDPAYQDLTSEVPSGVLSMWFDVQDMMDLEGFEELSATNFPTQIAMSLSFASGRMTFSTAQHGDEDQPDDVGVVRLDALPSGGLLYARLPQLGARMTSVLDAVDAASQLEGAPIDADGVDEALESIGTSVEELAGWMGDLAFVVGYDPTSDLDNAFMELHLGTGDEQATQALLDQALAEMPSDPDAGLVIEDGRLEAGDLTVEVSDGRLQVIAGGSDDVLGIGDNARFTDAVDGLEGDPVMFLDVRGMAQVIAQFVDEGDLDDLQLLGAFDAIAATQGDPRAPTVRSDLVVSWSGDWSPLVAEGTGDPALPDITMGTTSLADLMDGGFDVPGPGLDPQPFPAANTYGDDPALDALWEQCAEGDMAACDALWSGSAIGSGYEDFAEICGGAGARELTCELDFGEGPTLPGGDPTAAATPVDVPPPGTDAELDPLWDACADADMQACDDLFWAAPVGSDYEEFGRTCGDRVDSFANCTVLFPDN